MFRTNMTRMPVYTRRLKNPGVGSLNVRFMGQTIKLDRFPLRNSWCWMPNNKTTSPSLSRPHCRPTLPGMNVPTYLELEKVSVLFDLFDYSSYRAQPTLYLKEVKSLTETDIRRISLWGTFYLLPKFSASERLQISWRSAGDLVERSYLQIFKICKWILPGGKENSR